MSACQKLKHCSERNNYSKSLRAVHFESTNMRRTTVFHFEKFHSKSYDRVFRPLLQDTSEIIIYDLDSFEAVLCGVNKFFYSFQLDA